MAQMAEKNLSDQNLATVLPRDKFAQQNDNRGQKHCKYLTFILGDEVYGFDILTIKEIIEYNHVCKVPMAPEYIRGVINLRGNVVPVIDLATRLGFESAAVNKRTCIVILEVSSEDEKIDVGVVVDAVNEVLDIRQEDIEPTPTFGVDLKPEFIEGMGRVKNNFIVLLDLLKVLDVNDLSEFSFD